MVLFEFALSTVNQAFLTQRILQLCIRTPLKECLPSKLESTDCRFFETDSFQFNHERLKELSPYSTLLRTTDWSSAIIDTK
jgi:hypothetical protein